MNRAKVSDIWPRPEKLNCYFITGTGRCGTMLLSKLFSRSRRTCCFHEKIFRHQSMVNYFLNRDFKSYHEDIENNLVEAVQKANDNGKSYGISSGHMYFSINALYRIYKDRVRFISLIRRPEDFVRSALARGFFDETHPYFCQQISPSPQSKLHIVWETMSPFEKCLWYWEMVNNEILTQFSKIPPQLVKIFPIEDITTENARTLCEFLHLYDISDSEIRKTLNFRINSTPDHQKNRRNNPYSIPFPIPTYANWSTNQKKLLERYTGALRHTLYGDKKPI